MFSYLDSPLFYLIFLIYILIICCLTTIFFIYHKKKPKILEIQFIIRILLISGFTIYLLDAIPYSIMDIRDVPAFNMNISIIVLFLLSYSAILFELSKYTKNHRDQEE